ncbi:MAG: LytTR family DNA-binding domain-containing protein [Oscillospiraceae bacterium]|jgi:DNA-binding LytR/AlgR family response regulator|nr:LytTR family DNA-binding domain-containing protein [Oscillospiraceae bacterium]
MGKEIHIAICDDEQAQLDILEQCIYGCDFWRGRMPMVERFSQGAELLRRIKSGTLYSHVFLDIQMPDIDGVELCGEIRKISKMPVIFVSTHMERQPDIDGLFPAMLLSKPYTSDNLNNLLTAYSARVEAMNPYIYRTAYETRAIPIKDIVYVSVKKSDGGIQLHLIDEEPKSAYDITLSQMADDYTKQGLLKCHKSYVINLRYYLMNTYKEVHLRRGSEVVKLPLSRELAAGNTLRNIYLNFSDGGFYV